MHLKRGKRCRERGPWCLIRTLIKSMLVRGCPLFPCSAFLGRPLTRKQWSLESWPIRRMMTRGKLSRYSTLTLRNYRDWWQVTTWRWGYHLRSILLTKKKFEATQVDSTKTTSSGVRVLTKWIWTKKAISISAQIWNRHMALSTKRKIFARTAETISKSSKAKPQKSFRWSNTTLCLAKTQVVA